MDSCWLRRARGTVQGAGCSWGSQSWDWRCHCYRSLSPGTWGPSPVESGGRQTSAREGMLPKPGQAQGPRPLLPFLAGRQPSFTEPLTVLSHLSADHCLQPPDQGGRASVAGTVDPARIPLGIHPAHAKCSWLMAAPFYRIALSHLDLPNAEMLRGSPPSAQPLVND